MQNFFDRVFHVQPSEKNVVLTLGSILFANYMAMGITKVISVSGFLSQVKDHYILLVWAIDMVLLILATGLQSLIVDRFNRIKLLGGVLICFSLLYAILPIPFLIKTFPSAISYTLIYLLNDQQWRFFPVVFWILANDIFAPAQGRRLIPIIANFAFIGTLAGLGIGAVDARLHFGPVRLLLLNALIFALAFLVSRTGLRTVQVRNERASSASMKETFAEGWEFIRTVPAFAYLSFGMLAAGGVMTILLYDTLSDAKFELGNGFQSFYAQYNLAIAIISIVVQSLTSRVIEKLTLKNAFLVQPIVMLGSATINFFAPGYVSSASAQAAARVTYETFDLSSRKALQALVPNERRGRVSMFIDSYLPSLGTILGSLVTFGIITIGLHLTLPREEYTLIYIGLAIIMAILAALSALGVRKTYESSMLNWQLKRRARGANVLSRLDFEDK